MAEWLSAEEVLEERSTIECLSDDPLARLADLIAGLPGAEEGADA